MQGKFKREATGNILSWSGEVERTKVGKKSYKHKKYRWHIIKIPQKLYKLFSFFFFVFFYCFFILFVIFKRVRTETTKLLTGCTYSEIQNVFGGFGTHIAP